MGKRRRDGHTKVPASIEKETGLLHVHLTFTLYFPDDAHNGHFLVASRKTR